MRIAAIVKVRDEEEVLPWLVANLTFADQIYICDGGSTDRTREVMDQLADEDRRIRTSSWPDAGKWYERQWEHYNYSISKVSKDLETTDGWFWFCDADEIPCLELQRQVRDTLSCLEWCGNIGVEIPFLYLASGWREYYREVSRWPILRVFDHLPVYMPDASGKEQTVDYSRLFRVPLDTPPILHFNWAMERRFAEKRKHYEEHFGGPSWHPDEKFKDRTVLPNVRWYAPDGEIVGPDEMEEYYRL